MKRSSKGKAYFYAYGQQDKLLYGDDHGAYAVFSYRRGKAWPMWAQIAYENGFSGH